ncbi:MAG: glycosyltransferase family 2 protein, partial [Bacteroidales bacterium]|nr:glycosyltransferase family 2 protein [Bacteroidales bacterium]
MNPIFETYFTRFEAFEQQSQKPVDRNLGIIVTIPCYHEPDILQTLNCLWNCTMPSCHVEVIIVVNHSETADNSIKQFNQKTFEQLCEYSSAKSTGTISFLPLAAFNISKKQAGVGYARKLAMDEAV